MSTDRRLSYRRLCTHPPTHRHSCKTLDSTKWQWLETRVALFLAHGWHGSECILRPILHSPIKKKTKEEDKEKSKMFVNIHLNIHISMIGPHLLTVMHWKHTMLSRTLSKLASISSMTKKGEGWKEWIANKRARAATAFSPPDNWSISPKRKKRKKSKKRQ